MTKQKIALSITTMLFFTACDNQSNTISNRFENHSKQMANTTLPIDSTGERISPDLDINFYENYEQATGNGLREPGFIGKVFVTDTSQNFFKE